MTTIDTALLRALAEKATPGPWVAGKTVMWDETPQASVNASGAPITWDDHSGEVFTPEDAAYIAAADPATMIALLEERDELDRAVDEQIDMRKVVQEERDALQARIDAAEDFVTRHYLDTQMGGSVLAILSAPTENGENDDQ